LQSWILSETQFDGKEIFIVDSDDVVAVVVVVAAAM